MKRLNTNTLIDAGQEYIKRFVNTPKCKESDAYKMGFDCGKNGSNETNSHFSIFSSPENTSQWQRGMLDSRYAK